MELIALFIFLLFLNFIFNNNKSAEEPETEQKEPQHKQPDLLEVEPYSAPTKPDTNPAQFTNQFCTAEEKAVHLKSLYWHNLKQQRLAFAQHKCESCSCSEYLYLHHVDYSNLLAEKLSDVAVVCYKCHQDIHNRLGYDRTTLYPISTLKD